MDASSFRCSSPPPSPRDFHLDPTCPSAGLCNVVTVSLECLMFRQLISSLELSRFVRGPCGTGVLFGRNECCLIVFPLLQRCCYLFIPIHFFSFCLCKRGYNGSQVLQIRIAILSALGKPTEVRNGTGWIFRSVLYVDSAKPAIGVSSVGLSFGIVSLCYIIPHFA